MWGKYKLSTVVTSIIVGMTLTFLLILIAVMIKTSSSSYNTGRESVFEDLMRHEKEQVISQVDQIASYLEYSEEDISSLLREALNKRIDVAYSTAIQINDTHQNMGQEEKEHRMADTLRAFRFDLGLGYYTIKRLDGTLILDPMNPELEGKNIIDYKDAYGNFVIKEEVNVAQQYGEGYVEEFGYSVDDTNKGELKIAYVKRLEGLDYYVETGIYKEHFIASSKERVFENLKNLLNTNHEADLFFIADFEGNYLYSNGKDIQGQKMTNAELRAAKTAPLGDFIEIDPLDKKYNLMYTRVFKPWKWIIGVRFNTYVDKISTIDTYYFERTFKILFQTILLITVVVFAGIYFFAKRFRKQIESCFRRFKAYIIKDISVDNIPYCFKEFEMLEKSLMEKQERNKRSQLEQEPIPIDSAVLKYSPVNSLVEGEAVANRLVYELNQVLESNVQDYETSLKLGRIGSGLASLKNLLAQMNMEEGTAEFIPSEMHFEMFPFKAYMIKTLNIMAQEYEDFELTYTVHCDSDLKVYSDPMVFSKILIHLTTNAILHGFKGRRKGHITVEAIYDDDYLRVYFSDNGMGMEQEIQERIFEPYFTTAPLQGHSGLGLSEVHSIVNDFLEGAINCSSRYGYGTDFYIDIPGIGPGLWLSWNMEEK